MFSGSRTELRAEGVYIYRALSEMLADQPVSDDDSDPASDISANIKSEDYQYSPLSGPFHVRLLTLQPGRRREPVRCTLYETDLATCHGQYETLSYVWGPQEDLVRIQIMDSGLDIGPNLAHALVDMRHEENARTLWIDAICIDQANAKEKNTQVPLMKDIYTNSLHTICYLGPRIPKRTRKLYSMLSDLAQEAKTRHMKKPIITASAAMEPIHTFLNHVPFTPVESDLFGKYEADDTITDIAAAAWWHRAWTVQELLLSPYLIIMTGRYAMSWDDFRAAVDHGLNLQIWSPVKFGFFIDMIIVPYLSIRSLDQQRRLRQQESGNPYPDASTRDLLDILTQCRHRESQNPRDKIYAFLGLLQDSRAHAAALDDPSQMGIAVDYGLPVAYTYRLVSMIFMEKLQSLDILGVCPPSRMRGKPSWVTDWSATSALATPLSRDSLDRERNTHATKGTLAGCVFPADGQTLVLSGYVLTTVTQLSGTLPLASLNFDSNKIDQKIESIEIGTQALDSPAQEFLGNDPAPVVRTVSEPVQPANKRKDWRGRLGRISDDAVATTKTAYNTTKSAYSTTKSAYKATTSITGSILKLTRNKIGRMVSVFTQLFAWERFVAAGPPGAKQAPADSDSYHYWQTLCAGTYKDESQEQTQALFKDWLTSLQPVRDFIEKPPTYPEERPELVLFSYSKSCWSGYSHFWPYIACAQQRRLGWTDDGRLCLLPAESEVGDLIILACGGRAPLVLRADGDGYHEFVGEAYIHGVMDGEKFEQEKCQEIKIC